jgi:hypothetical protein
VSQTTLSAEQELTLEQRGEPLEAPWVQAECTCPNPCEHDHEQD